MTDKADYWKTYSFAKDPDFRVADLTIADVEKLLFSLDQQLISAKSVLREWFPLVMAYWSEEVLGSGWSDANVYNLIPGGPAAAGLLGEVPAWDGEATETSGLRLGWKPYTNES